MSINDASTYTYKKYEFNKMLVYNTDHINLIRLINSTIMVLHHRKKERREETEGGKKDGRKKRKKEKERKKRKKIERKKKDNPGKMKDGRKNSIK